MIIINIVPRICKKIKGKKPKIFLNSVGFSWLTNLTSRLRKLRVRAKTELNVPRSATVIVPTNCIVLLGGWNH